jgi:MFS transporter, DHA3 family, macrolide efflux protein
MSESATAQPGPAPRGMLSFTIIWFGQLISTFGSGLTNVALGVWAYEQTQSATLFALILTFGLLPGILLAPVAGVIIDRYDRRRLLIACDVASAACMLVVALLLITGQLAIWNILLIVVLGSIIGVFQTPAYTAATTMLIPKEQYTRASGMIQTSTAASQIVTPFAAGFLYWAVGLQGIALIDFISFLVGALTLMMVHIPNPETQPGAAKEKKSMLAEAKIGWQFISERRGLLSLLGFFAIINFSFAVARVVFTPMVLRIWDPRALGGILSLGGIGFLLGSLALTTWGGPKRKTDGVLGFGFLFGAALLMAGISPTLALIGAASLGVMLCIPFINGCSQAIWQAKVPPQLQGRVFAMRLMIAWASAPLAYLLAGAFIDTVFEPAMKEGGALASSIGQIIGVGPGRGSGLLFVIFGLIAMLAAVVAYFYRPLRLVEDELPDAVVVAAAEPEIVAVEPESAPAAS